MYLVNIRLLKVQKVEYLGTKLYQMTKFIVILTNNCNETFNSLFHLINPNINMFILTFLMNLQKVRFQDINNFKCLLANSMKWEGKRPRHLPPIEKRALKGNGEWRKGCTVC